MSGPLDRALGALVGGALGDALGMPAESLAPAEITARYGRIEGFVAPPAGRGLALGTVTDDTEQTLLLGRVLLESKDRGFDHDRWVAALLAWEEDTRRRGSHDLLGPSTRRALAAIRAGQPVEEAGRSGSTNGAAMRIAPVGIAWPPEPLDALIDAVAATCLATHNTSLAIAAAAAVAAAVSAGIDGAGWPAAVALAVKAARRGAKRGAWAAGGEVALRIEWARSLVHGRPPEAAAALVAELVGTSLAAQESVPAAFAVLEIAGGAPWPAAVLAANLGGDTDTIGAIAGAIGGACAGFAALPADQMQALRGFDLAAASQLAAGLLARRGGGP
jgi:ADP-ribosylglycohydrolase